MHDFLDRPLIERIEICYKMMSGRPLPGPDRITDREWWLHYTAPYSILAHNGGADPHFIYANEFALRCFKYSREEMLSLPSRLSAAAPDQQERQKMLSGLASKGIVHGYSGVRVTRQGASFSIHNGVIWQLKNDDGTLWGQAAFFWLSPEESEQFL